MTMTNPSRRFDRLVVEHGALQFLKSRRIPSPARLSIARTPIIIAPEVAVLSGGCKSSCIAWPQPTNRTRAFELGLGPLALSFLGAAGREDLAAAGSLIARFPTTWPAEWLRRRGLSNAATEWTQLSPSGSTAG